MKNNKIALKSLPIILLCFTLNGYAQVAKFFSDANMALMMAVLVGMYTLGIRQGKKIPEIIKFLNKSVGAIAMIILIIATDGAGHRLRKFDVFAFQRYRILDVQGILQRQHQTNLRHLDGNGMLGGPCLPDCGAGVNKHQWLYCYTALLPFITMNANAFAPVHSILKKT